MGPWILMDKEETIDWIKRIDGLIGRISELRKGRVLRDLLEVFATKGC